MSKNLCEVYQKFVAHCFQYGVSIDDVDDLIDYAGEDTEILSQIAIETFKETYGDCSNLPPNLVSFCRRISEYVVYRMIMRDESS